ncbi:MAG: hypothetical protein ACI4XR_02500 [Bacilli bacterium]
MNKKNHGLVLMIILITSIILGMILLDYFNVLYKNNIIISNFNIEIWDIIVNSLVVITLYFVTYKKIDKKLIEQANNKRDIAYLLLKKTYSSCKEDIGWMEKEDYRTKASSKINGDEDINKSSVYKKMIDSPFESHEIILNFAQEGIITSVDLEDYLDIKNEFRKFITMSIIFFDKYEYVVELKMNLEKNIESAIKKLK